MVPHEYLNMRYYMLLNFLPVIFGTQQSYFATSCHLFRQKKVSIGRDKASEVHYTLKKYSLKPIKRCTQS